MAIILEGSGTVTGITTFTTPLDDIKFDSIEVTGIATASTFQVGTGVSIGNPRLQNIALYTNDSEWVTVDNVGNVGFGTTNAQIAADTNNAKVINAGIVTANQYFGNQLTAAGVRVTGVSTFAAVTGTTGTFSGAVSGTTGTFTGDVDIADKIIHTGDTDTAIRFPAADTITAETGGTERLRIHSNGQISINSSNTPEAQVDIYQSGQSSTTLSMLIGANEGGAGGQGRTNSNAKAARIGCPHYTNDEESLNIVTAYSGATTNNLYWGGGTGVLNSATSHHFYTAANNTTTGGTERLRITSDGAIQNYYNSSLPVTDSRPILQLGYGVIGDNSSGYNDVTCNAYPVNGDSSYHYIGSSSLGATRYQLTFGSHIWSTASAGTRGNDITWSERLRITSDGNVGINEASPDRELHVSSASNGGIIRLTNTSTSISNGTICGMLEFEQLDSNTPGVSANIRAEMADTTNGANQLCFSTGTPSTIGTRMTIKSDGEINLSGDLVFTTAGKGIVLGSTTNTDANTLDEYEEGTWTPGMNFASGTVTSYYNQEGTYTRVGRVVTAHFRLRINNAGGASGAAQISGLPFTVYDVMASTGLGGFGGPTYWAAMNTNIVQLNFTPEDNSTNCYIYYATGATGTLSPGSETLVGNGWDVRAYVTYYTTA